MRNRIASLAILMLAFVGCSHVGDASFTVDKKSFKQDGQQSHVVNQSLDGDSYYYVGVD